MPDQQPDLSSDQETRLRSALRLIGDELASGVGEPPEQAAPARSRRWWERHRVSLAAAAAIVVVAGAAAIADLRRGGEPEDPPEATQSLTDAEWVACAAGIGIGEIAEVRPGGTSDTDRLTVAVDRWLKAPDPAVAEVSFSAMSGAFTDDPAFRPGQEILFVLQEPQTEPAEVYRAGNPKVGQDAASAERLVRANLAASEESGCPAFWRDRGATEGGRDDS